MKKSLAIFFLFFFIFTAFKLYSQEGRLIIKPEGFDYKKIYVEPEKYFPISTEIRHIQTSMGVMDIYPNIRLVSTTGNQTELSATIWTVNPNYIFVGANSDPGQGYYFTTNGGVSWSGGDLLPNSVSASSDPACAYSYTGVIHYNYFDNTMVSDRSSNGGANWLGRINIPAGNFDKNHNAVDVNPSSPYYGRVYVVWANTSNWATVLSYSTDGGSTYLPTQTIGAPISGHGEQGCNIQVGPGGVVYCIWASRLSSGTIQEDGIGFTKSTNGGVNWTTPTIPITISGIRGTILSTAIRTSSFPVMAVDRSGGPRNGYIYVSWIQKNLAPAGSDPDVCFAYSSNGGTSWSTPVRVNNDPINNGKQQFHNWMTVDQTNGNIAIMYYDTRDVSSTDSCNTYVAISQNGGSTFNNIKVSDHAQRPAPLSGYATGYYGDYNAIIAHNNVIWTFWADNRSGPAQVYGAKVVLGPSIQHTQLGNTEQISGTIPVNCVITPSGSGINPSTVQLKYAKNSTTWTTVTMTNTSGTNWTANLTLSGAGTYNYYLTATDSLSRVVTAPSGAPTSYYSFSATTDTIKPVITHTPLGNQAKQNWPVLVSATVTDNIGVDSAWVRWYKNTTSNYKQFKLSASGSTYSAQFNSLSSDVVAGDTIFYRIIAQDNSSSHNRDSTALYKFAITNIVTNNICRTVWVPIRDNATNYDSFQVGTHSSIIKVNFTMNELVHTFDNDVTFALRSPSGTEVVLSANHGSSGDNYINTVFNDSATATIASGTAPFTGTYKPDNPLSAFNGQDTYGWWRLRVNDNASGDTGHVRTYCTQIFSTSVISNIVSNGKVPTEYALTQNYPNPFNPVTKISFAIPKQGLVTLKIYDILGREVKTLVNEIKSPGEYSIDFNGSEFASGVYFYRLEANGFMDIKKMMLIK